MPDLRVPYDAKVTVDHDSPEPLYRQVAALLRGRITSGEFTGRLPSLKTIAQEYGVSHITAEKAMDLLKEEGLVVVVVGRGAYVKKDLGTIRSHAEASRIACHGSARPVQLGRVG